MIEFEFFFEYFSMISLNGLETTIAKTFPMQEFRKAYQFAQQGGVIGKVVFVMS